MAVKIWGHFWVISNKLKKKTVSKSPAVIADFYFDIKIIFFKKRQKCSSTSLEVIFPWERISAGERKPRQLVKLKYEFERPCQQYNSILTFSIVFWNVSEWNQVQGLWVTHCKEEKERSIFLIIKQHLDILLWKCVPRTGAIYMLLCAIITFCNFRLFIYICTRPGWISLSLRYCYRDRRRWWDEFIFDTFYAIKFRFDDDEFGNYTEVLMMNTWLKCE